ncbi:MAG: DUF2961 domain-containing protein [Pirellulaceae bacterium]
MPITLKWLHAALAAIATLVIAGNASGGDQESAAASVAVVAAVDRQVEDESAASVDLRPNFESRGLITRVQGNRGTCSVFVMTGVIEYAVAGRQGRSSPLSVEFLNWASNQAAGEAEDGGFFSDLWKGFARFGICLEEDMPYRDSFDPQIQPSNKALERASSLSSLGLQLHWIKQWNPHHGLTDEQFIRIKETLQRRYPVCGGFLWPKQQQWEEGVLTMCPRNAVRDGHSVLLVGYRDDPSQPGGGLFLIRNTAGESRDGCLTYEYVRTYMNDAVWVDIAGAEGSGASGQPQATDDLATQQRATDSDAASDSGQSQPPGRPDGGEKGSNASFLFHDSLGAVVAPPVGRNRRISSNEQPRWNDANLDMNWLQPGQVLELPVLQGPGVINHMWFTSHAGWANELNALSIRIYWDGRTEPGVEAPLGDFFAVGQGKPASVESVPVQVSPTGSLTCYWRMPFTKSARIVITNDNPDRGAGLYWQVDWVQLARLSPETPYFHAQYRQEYPAAAGQDYMLADLTGCGQFVGTVMSVTMAQDGWFGEGDDFFYIDGEQVPSLQGTGSEDYFNDAWGFRERTGPWFGQPRWQGDRAGDSGVCYRWHLLDPVGFTKSLRVTIEHKGNYDDDLVGFYVERPEFVSSVAFWYQTGEPQRFAGLPPWPQRRVPWHQQHLVRAFLAAESTGAAKVAVQTQGFFGARPLLSWPNTEIGAQLTLPFTVNEEGNYAVRLTALKGPLYGKYDILIDDTRVGEGDFQAAEDDELDLPVCVGTLAKGSHKLTFQALNAAGTGEQPVARPMAVEMLRLLKLPPPARREVKTHHEAHFVRLGIGRALYAYRLAYGKLPDSLETLVEVGIMPARYLKDENELPLKYRREGEFMVVESPAPNGWKHRWEGLDPRR